MVKLKEFNDLVEWMDYVHKHMREGTRRKNIFDITVRDREGQVIAKWNLDGSGQVWEKRSEERLHGDGE